MFMTLLGINKAKWHCQEQTQVWEQIWLGTLECEENQPRKQKDFADVSRIPKAYCLHIPILQGQHWDKAL